MIRACPAETDAAHDPMRFLTEALRCDGSSDIAVTENSGPWPDAAFSDGPHLFPREPAAKGSSVADGAVRSIQREVGRVHRPGRVSSSVSSRRDPEWTR
jgi:hypothetical protein